MKNNKHNNNNLPTLRFPEFTGEWKKMRLKDIVTKSAEKNRNNKIKTVFSNSAIQGIVLQEDYFDRNIVNKDNLVNYYIVRPNDFVYNPRLSSNAEVGAMSVNHTGIIGVVSPLYTIFSITNEKISSVFLEWVFKSKVWHKYMRDVANFGARDDRMNIKSEDFYSLPIQIPNLNEQEKIARFLSLIDERISTQNKIIEDLKLLKSVLADKVLSGNIKFNEFNNDWHKTVFDKVCIIKTGDKNTQDKEEGGKYPFYVRSKDVERINSYSFEGEAILTAGDGDIGKIFHYVNGKVGVHQRVYILSDFKCYGKYLYYYFSTLFYRRVIKMSAKNTVDSVRMEMISKMPLLLPSVEEQKKISYLLDSIEDKVLNANKLQVNYKLQKYYLLSQLFI